MDRPQMEEQRGGRTEISTQAELSKEGRKITKEAKRLVQDAMENVGAPPNLHRQRRSPERYTGYMDLMTRLVGTDPSSFKEAVERPTWVDAMME